MTVSRSGLAGLLKRVAARDHVAFEQVYRTTSAKLLGVIMRILKRRDIAEEVLQEVYVRVWERAGDYDPAIAAPVTWMATIARNRALDVARRKAPVSLDEVPGLENIQSDTESALTSVEKREEAEHLRRCLQTLDPDKRELVLVAYFHGVSRDELAKKYGFPVGTIKTWLRRSLALLKDCLGR